MCNLLTQYRLVINTHAEIAPKKISDANKHKIRKSCLNLNNSETIEFRMFKSTLNKQMLLKNIEFCDALIRFTWPGICGYDAFKNDGVRLFCAYVKENKDIYPNLHEFLGKIKYLKKKRRGRPRKYISNVEGFISTPIEEKKDYSFWYDMRHDHDIYDTNKLPWNTTEKTWRTI